MAIHATISKAAGRMPTAVLHLHGELNAANSRDLTTEALKAHAAGARAILLDLRNLSHMSSSGLVAPQSIAALMQGGELSDPDAGWSAAHAIRRDRDLGLQRHVKLLNPQPGVDRVLQTAGFRRYVEVLAGMDEAVASF